MDTLRLQEAAVRLKEFQDQLKTGLARGSTIQVLDDLHGFWKSRVEGRIHGEDVVHAYNSLREHADSLSRGDDAIDKIKAAVDRLLEFIRMAIQRGTATT